VRDDDSALDIVQDAMMRLAEKYGERPAAELPLLFQRILQNGIRDHYRRQRVRNLWTTLLSTLRPRDDDEADPLDTLRVDTDGQVADTPDGRLLQAQTLAAIEAEIRKLPQRQREAFLLRYWEDMNTGETARIMGCSEGSVKTHCSRATHALATALRAKGIDL